MIKKLNIPMFKLIFLLLFLFNKCDSKLPATVSCVDEKCSQPISIGKTISMYQRGADYMISFSPNTDVTIYSKSQDLWEVEVNNGKIKRGFVPKNFISESKIYVNKEKLIKVPTKMLEKQDSQTKIDNGNKQTTESFNSNIEQSLNESNETNRESELEIENKDNKNTIPNVEGMVLANENKNSNLERIEEINEKIESKAIDNNQTDQIIKASVEQNTKDEISANLNETQSQDNVLDKSKEIKNPVNIDESNIENTLVNNSDLFNETQSNKNSKDNPNEIKDTPVVHNPENKIQSQEETSTIKPNVENPLKEVENSVDNIKDINDTTTMKTVSEAFLKESESLQNTVDNIKDIESFENAVDNIKHINDTTTIKPVSEAPFRESESLQNTVDNIKDIEPLENAVDNIKDINDTTTTKPVSEAPLKESESLQNTVDNIKDIESLQKAVDNIKKNESLENPVNNIIADPRNSYENSDEIKEIPTATEKIEIQNQSHDHKIDNLDPINELQTTTEFIKENPLNVIKETLTTINPTDDNSSKELYEELKMDPTQKTNFMDVSNENVLSKEDHSEEVLSSYAPDIEPDNSKENFNHFDPINKNTDSVINFKNLYNENIDIERTTEPQFREKSDSELKNDPYEDIGTIENEQVDENNSKGFFTDIYEKIFSLVGKNNDQNELNEEISIFEERVDRTLFPEKYLNKKENEISTEEEVGFCENLTPNSCPYSSRNHKNIQNEFTQSTNSIHAILNNPVLEKYIEVIFDRALEMQDLILYLSITAVTVLSFIFGHYCIDKSRKESPLLKNLNVLERSLMVCKKECAGLQNQLEETRGKLSMIEDNSFGSNEMVISLKSKLEESEELAENYKQQIVSLEKELEAAAESGLELNRMVSELLNNQSFSISGVEELKKQLTEQQDTILSINTTLAEKSRENSELQILLSEQKTQYDELINELELNKQSIEEKNEHLEKELLELSNSLEIKLNDLKHEYSKESVKLKSETQSIKQLNDDLERKLHKLEAKNQILNDHLSKLKNDSHTSITETLDVINLKSDLIAITKENEKFKENLEQEKDKRKSLEDHIKTIGEEVSILKQEYSTAEKEKVEAQTRLDVLSGYFKEKETQLQKELSIKEAMWLQSQGETTSTVERVRQMQDEIQTLKSQNDSLRVEIEAQSVAHKTQISGLESRAHEAWLSARQAERKLEEARIEAAGLRRKLTTIGDNTSNVTDRGLNAVDGVNDMNAPSPIHMVDNPGSPIMGLPPPPFMPPFMGPPPPPPHGFIPPPFLPGEMRPPPLGRLMSPPPHRYSPNMLDDRDRYSPDRDRNRRGRSHSSDGHDYYDDGLSPYETETDFGPPSPGPPRHGYRDNRGYKPYSPLPPDNRNKKTSGDLS